MGNKTVILKENQFKRIIENRVNEVTAVELVDVLKGIPCTGEGIKSLINKKLMEYGFDKVNIKFLGYGDDNKLLRYIVHTDGPVFVIGAMSRSNSQPPCMEVVDVIAYTKV